MNGNASLTEPVGLVHWVMSSYPDELDNRRVPMVALPTLPASTVAVQPPQTTTDLDPVRKPLVLLSVLRLLPLAVGLWFISFMWRVDAAVPVAIALTLPSLVMTASMARKKTSRMLLLVGDLVVVEAQLLVYGAIFAVGSVASKDPDLDGYRVWYFAIGMGMLLVAVVGFIIDVREMRRRTAAQRNAHLAESNAALTAEYWRDVAAQRTANEQAQSRQEQVRYLEETVFRIPRWWGDPGSNLNSSTAAEKMTDSSIRSGRRGEFLTAEIIARLQDRLPGMFALHSVRWPGSTTEADVDHVIIAGRTVFLADSKNWQSGHVYNFYEGGLVLRDGQEFPGGQIHLDKARKDTVNKLYSMGGLPLQPQFAVKALLVVHADNAVLEGRPDWNVTPVLGSQLENMLETLLTTATADGAAAESAYLDAAVLLPTLRLFVTAHARPIHPWTLAHVRSFARMRNRPRKTSTPVASHNAVA